MDDVLVSIIVPVYKVEKYLQECLDSILHQSHKNLEIILVDDGSPDKSGEICDKYAMCDNRIKVIHKDNGGLVSAWMCGLEESVAEWIVFIDGDDWMEEEHIHCLINEQCASNADVVVAQMKEVIGTESRLMKFEVPTGSYKGKRLEETIYPVMINAGGFEKRGISGSRCSKLIRRKLMIDNLCYEYRNATYKEDFNIMYPVLMDAQVIALVTDDNAAYCYRRTEGSMLHGYDANMIRSSKEVHKQVQQALIDKNKSIFQIQLLSEYLSSMIRCYTNELQNPGGIDQALKNIMGIAEDHLFQECIRKVKWENYPKKFKLIIYSMESKKRGYIAVLYRLLRIAKIVNR